MRNFVTIDSFPESAHLYEQGHAIVAVDVIRASTTIVTAIATGRRCFPVSSASAAFFLSKRLVNPLLAGEVGGIIPEGFEMNNSPSELERRSDTYRPMVLLSSSGTKLIYEARRAEALYIGCFRNMSTLAEFLARHHARVALIGAGSRGEFREEDQLACAWIARKLVGMGYKPQGNRTEEIMEIWSSKKACAIACGKSADYLRRSGQTSDLDFVISHLDDTLVVPMVCGGEAVEITLPRPPMQLPGEKTTSPQTGISLR